MKYIVLPPLLIQLINVNCTLNCCHSESESSESLATSKTTPCGFLHKSTSAMQKHDSEHDKPVLLHEQFPLHPLLQEQVVSSKMLRGAGSFVM